MTTQFDVNEAHLRLALFHEEIVPRLKNAVHALAMKALAYADKGDQENYARIFNKSKAVLKVILEQKARLQGLRTVDEAYVLIALIEANAEVDGADVEGTNLAISYIREMLDI